MIAFDAAVAGRNWQTGDPQTWSHTCSGTDRVLFVGIFLGGTVDRVNGVTYNGVSMTRLAKINDLSGNANYVYFLINPATGSNTVSVDLTSSVNMSAASVSYNGVDQTTPIDAWRTDAGVNGGASWTTGTITVTATDAWLLTFLRDTNANAVSATKTKRVGTTVVLEVSFDSNGTVPTGSTSVTYTSAALRIDGHTLIALKPAGGAPPAPTPPNFFAFF
jgi:hypothetical protein